TLVVGEVGVGSAREAVEGVVGEGRGTSRIRLTGDVAHVIPQVRGAVDHRAVGAQGGEARQAVVAVPGIGGLGAVREDAVYKPARRIVVIAHLEIVLVLLGDEAGALPQRPDAFCA